MPALISSFVHSMQGKLVQKMSAPAVEEPRYALCASALASAWAQYFSERSAPLIPPTQGQGCGNSSGCQVPFGVPLYPVAITWPSRTMTQPTLRLRQVERSAAANARIIAYDSLSGRPC